MTTFEKRWKHPSKILDKDQKERTMTDFPHLSEVGELIYGEQWRRKLGRILGVNEHTIRRWARDGMPIRVIPELEDVITIILADLEEAESIIAPYIEEIRIEKDRAEREKTRCSESPSHTL